MFCKKYLVKLTSWTTLRNCDGLTSCILFFPSQSPWFIRAYFIVVYNFHGTISFYLSLKLSVFNSSKAYIVQKARHVKMATKSMWVKVLKKILHFLQNKSKRVDNLIVLNVYWNLHCSHYDPFLFCWEWILQHKITVENEVSSAATGILSETRPPPLLRNTKSSMQNTQISKRLLPNSN